MNTVIVAGGLGTRFKELSCFPKILLPTKEKDSILLEQLGYFSKWDKITIIVNEKFYAMVLNYIEVNNLTNVKVVASSNTNGSGNTIASVYNELPKKDVMFFWSDIVFERNAFERSEGFRIPNDEVIIYTSEEEKYRYLIEDGKVSNVSETYDGNIPGIFYINDISRVIPEVREQETDLVDFIIEAQNRGFIKKVTDKPLPAPIIEYRSLEDYKTILEMSNYKRAFAKLNNQWKITKNWEIDIFYMSNTAGYFEEQTDWAKARNYILHDAVEMVKCEHEYGSAYKLKNLTETDKLFVNCDDNTKEAAMDSLKEHIYNQKEITKEVSVLDMENIVDDLVDNAIHGLCDVSNLLLDKDPLDENTFENFRNYLKEKASELPVLNPIHGNLNQYTIVVDTITNDVKLLHHNGNIGFFGWQAIDEAAYNRIKTGIDMFMVDPVVYGDKCRIQAYWCYDLTRLAMVPYLHRVLNVLYVFAHLSDVATDVMKVNIMYDWIKFELDNLKNYDLNICDDGYIDEID